MFRDLSNHIPAMKFLSIRYRPARWESPMEQKLLYALRYLGLGVETQVPIGEHHVDMIVFGRSSSHEVIIECDSADFHHNLIDEFRDDELIETAQLPIAHISGVEIAESSERCALYVAERWFPNIMHGRGYIETLAMVKDQHLERHVDDASEFFPVGVVRPIAGDSYPSQSSRIYRDYVRFIVGDLSQCHFFNLKEQTRIEEWKSEFAKLGLPRRKYSPAELARFYILLFYHEPDLSYELQRLDSFLEYRRQRIESQEENRAEIPE